MGALRAHVDGRPHRVTAEVLQEKRQHEPELLVLDVREPEEYAAGHIPGAVLIPRGKLEFLADPTSSYAHPEMRPERPTVVYCQLGLRGLLAAATLKQLGYRDVANLDGGIDAWVEVDGEVATL